jgi:uncharacterized protein (DUF2141 family)
MMIRSKVRLVLLVSSLVLPVPFAGFVAFGAAPGSLGIAPDLHPEEVTFEPGSELERGTILIEVRGLRSDRGHVLGALFDSSASWGIEGRQIAVCRARIVRRRAYCPIERIDEGRYGFAFMHDENDNERMDTNFIGLPDEGFGFSNDAPVSFGPPSFDAVRFRHEGDVTQLVVQTRYGI